MFVEISGSYINLSVASRITIMKHHDGRLRCTIDDIELWAESNDLMTLAKICKIEEYIKRNMLS